MTFFERMFATRFGRLISSIFIYVTLFLTVGILNGIFNNFLGEAEQPLTLYVIFGFSALLLIQIVFDFFGFLDYDGFFEGFLAIIRFVLFIAVGLAIVFFVYCVGGMVYAEAREYGMELTASNVFAISLYTAFPVSIGLYFLFSTIALENYCEIVPFVGVGSYIISVIVGVIFGAIGVACNSDFIAFWLPFIMSCILFVIGVIFVFRNGFPVTDSIEVTFLDLLITLVVPFILLVRGIWFVIKYIGIFFIWLYYVIANAIHNWRNRH